MILSLAFLIGLVLVGRRRQLSAPCEGWKMWRQAEADVENDGGASSSSFEDRTARTERLLARG